MTEQAKAKAEAKDIWTKYLEGKNKKPVYSQEQHKRMSELQEQLDLFNSQLTLPHNVKYREAKKLVPVLVTDPDPDEIEEILDDNKENDTENKQPYKFEASRRTFKKKTTKGGSRKGSKRGSRKKLRRGSRKRLRKGR